jgi:hypothetical protein
MNVENIFVLFLGYCRPAEFGVIKGEEITKIRKKIDGPKSSQGRQRGKFKERSKAHSPQELNKKGER